MFTSKAVVKFELKQRFFLHVHNLYWPTISDKSPAVQRTSLLLGFTVRLYDEKSTVIKVADPVWKWPVDPGPGPPEKWYPDPTNQTTETQKVEIHMKIFLDYIFWLELRTIDKIFAVLSNRVRVPAAQAAIPPNFCYCTFVYGPWSDIVEKGWFIKTKWRITLSLSVLQIYCRAVHHIVFYIVHTFSNKNSMYLWFCSPKYWISRTCLHILLMQLGKWYKNFLHFFLSMNYILHSCWW